MFIEFLTGNNNNENKKRRIKVIKKRNLLIETIKKRILNKNVI